MNALAHPYDGASSEYRAWRQQRLAHWPTSAAQQFHGITPDFLHANHHATAESRNQTLESICHDVDRQGYSLYVFKDFSSDIRASVVGFYELLGLQESDTGVIAGEDQLSLLENSSDEAQRRFVPYSDRAMNWHTDGYYNSADTSIRTFCLHCMQPAGAGGELTLVDDELLLIALYDHDPDLISLLAHPEAMLVPASNDEFGHARPDRISPVFDVDAQGSLLTRFTTRRHNIQWRTPETKLAIETAIEILNNNAEWHTTVKLDAGQGVITRNILHCRTSFTDEIGEQGRQMLRGRYLQRLVAGGSARPTQ